MDNKTFKHWVVFSAFGEGCPVAYKLHCEGKDVLLALVEDIKTVESEEVPEEKDRRLKLFDGLVPKISAEKAVTKLKNVTNKDDYFLFFDLNCLYHYSEALLKAGFKYGNFFTKEDYELEADREKAKEMVKKYYPDLTVAPTYEFKKVKDAIKFLEDDEENFYVLKGDSDLGAKTVVPIVEDLQLAKKQIIEALEKNPQPYEKGGFILEKRIECPLEVTPAAFFFNGELVFSDIDIENKPIGSENRGYQVGAAQTLITPLEVGSRLHKAAFPPIVYKLAKKHTGLFNIDASIFVDLKTDTLYFGEFCTRPGYDSLFAEIAMARSAAGFFEDIVNGINPLVRDYGAAVRLFNLPSKPPYLYKGNDLKDLEVDWKVDQGIWPFDVKKVGEEKLTTGYTPDCAIATGFGEEVTNAICMAYDNAELYSLSGVYMRPKSDFLGSYKSSILERFYMTRCLAEKHNDDTRGPISAR